MKKKSTNKPSPTKLTLMLIMLPIMVVALMVVFWVIFTATRKQTVVAAYPDGAVVITAANQVKPVNSFIKAI